MGILTDLIEGEYGIKVRGEARTVSVLTTTTELAQNNDDRVALTVINLGASAVYMNIDTAVSASNGIRLGATGGSVSMNWRDDLVLPGREWHAIDPTGAVTVLVVEIIGLGQTT